MNLALVQDRTEAPSPLAFFGAALALITPAALAWAAHLAGDPDTVPSFRLRAAWRDVSCSGKGEQTYRRVRYPGSMLEEWPDSDRLPGLGYNAASRHCAVYADMPVGTIVVDYESTLYKGAKSRAKVTIGLVTHAGKISWLEHRTLRKRPVYEVVMPNGSKLEIERRA